MLKSSIIIPIGLVVLTLTACSSKPREVSASVPLVVKTQAKPNKQEVPAKYWAQLSDPVQTTVKHDKYQIKLSEIYISALGQTCRELHIKDKSLETKSEHERRTACEANYVNEKNEAQKGWFLEKKIIESRVYVEL